jgi:WxcM-like, C-terminal
MNTPQIIHLPKVADPRGNLTFLQYSEQLPFEIQRVFWTYDVPGGEQRGGHAYHKQYELIIALSGSFDVIITNKDGKKDTFSLNRSYYGLFVPPKTWRHMENFSTNSLGLHLSSRQFDPSDYIRDYDIYKNMKNE